MAMKCKCKTKQLEVKVYNKSDNPLPERKNSGDAGMDICSNEDKSIRAFSTAVIDTGLYAIIPYGYEGQVRSRSGLAAKYGLQVLNSPGTIDSGYRGEIKVIMINHNHYPYEVKKGDRIAQLVIKPVIEAQLINIDEAEHTIESDTEDRGGGLGSTGVK
ncbi:dUTP diphosphatase [Candidatus Pacearchaeota archaeon]|jgi:dUTP pyrophosphatase|nr:dUTP diphosphatase [Candidatus Pacearchaeota archaeon]|tara:strand:- start:728 stop:1204 length:477 start_codon:yes stop_codon:yes gene_type:complete